MSRGMLRLLAPGIGMLAACSLVTSPSPSPEASTAGTAPIPQTPPGWERIIAFGTGGQPSAAMGPVVLGPGPVALNATCVGSGTLVVVVGDAGVDEDQAAAHPSASFPCHVPEAGTGRVTLSGNHPRNATVSAFVIHGGYADFLVSVEQPIE